LNVNLFCIIFHKNYGDATEGTWITQNGIDTSYFVNNFYNKYDYSIIIF